MIKLRNIATGHILEIPDSADPRRYKSFEVIKDKPKPRVKREVPESAKAPEEQ